MKVCNLAKTGNYKNIPNLNVKTSKELFIIFIFIKIIINNFNTFFEGTEYSFKINKFFKYYNKFEITKIYKKALTRDF